jgi:hypothetical protein
LSPRPDLVVISSDIANPALPQEYEHAKILLSTAGEQAVSLEFEPRWPEVFKIEPQALHLHAWLPGEGFGGVVTHSVPTGDFPGPYSYGYADTAPDALNNGPVLTTNPLTLSSVTFNAYIPSAGATRLWR